MRYTRLADSVAVVPTWRGKEERGVRDERECWHGRERREGAAAVAPTSSTTTPSDRPWWSRLRQSSMCAADDAHTPACALLCTCSGGMEQRGCESCGAVELCVRGALACPRRVPNVHLVLDEHGRRPLAHPDPLLAPGVDLVPSERGDAAAADDDAGARIRQNLVAEQPRRPWREGGGSGGEIRGDTGRGVGHSSSPRRLDEPRLETSTPASWPSRSTQWRAT